MRVSWAWAIAICLGCVGSLDRSRLEAGSRDSGDADGEAEADVPADGDVEADGDADGEAEADVPADGDADADADVPADAGPGAPVRWFNAAGGVSSNSEYRLEGTLGGPVGGGGVSTNSAYRLESGGVRLIRGR